MINDFVIDNVAGWNQDKDGGYVCRWWWLKMIIIVAKILIVNSGWK